MNTTTAMTESVLSALPAETVDRASKNSTHLKFSRLKLKSDQRHEKINQLISQFKTLPTEVRKAEANQEACRMIEQIFSGMPEHQPDWGEIDMIARALLSIMSGEDLKRYAWALRSEFEEAASCVPADKALLAAYQATNPPDPNKATEAELRADLLSLQSQLQELRATRRVQIRARNYIAILTLMISALAILVTLRSDDLLRIHTIAFDVFGVGMLGGVFSTLLRIQSFKLGGKYEAAALSQGGNQLTVVMAPAIGGAGAVILYVMLVAGVIKGSFLPDLPSINFASGIDALEQMFNVQLASSAEAAKLYTLCLLAGFSERLVPDVMSRLADRVSKPE